MHVTQCRMVQCAGFDAAKVGRRRGYTIGLSEISGFN